METSDRFDAFLTEEGRYRLLIEAVTGTELGPNILRSRSGHISLLRKGDRVWHKRSPIRGMAGGDRITTSASPHRHHHIGPSVWIIAARRKNQGLNLLRIFHGESESYQRFPRMSENNRAWKAHLLKRSGNEVA